MTDQTPPPPPPPDRKKTAAPPLKARPSLGAVFDNEPDRQPVVTVRSASTTRPDPIRRVPRTLPIPSLSGLRPFWFMVGRGRVGKTTFARLMLSTMIQRGTDDVALLAVDPSLRLLAEFVSTVSVPPSTDPDATMEFLSDRLSQIAEQKLPGLADFGGGDVALAKTLSLSPNLDRTMEDAGVGIVAAYFFGPAPDEVSILEEHARLGFTPRATALVLNAHLIRSPTAYDSLRIQPAYRAAIDRGAVEIILPALPQDVAQDIEAHRYHFHEARDGIVPEGSPYPPLLLPGIKRAMVRGFIDSTLRELAPLEAAGWMPWT